MILILLLIISLLYFIKKREPFINTFNKNKLYNKIVDKHFTTDHYINKQRLKKCCDKNCKAKAKYMTKNCDKNKKDAKMNLKTQFELPFDEKEFKNILEESEKHYGNAKNELDLRYIKLDVPDDTNVYNKIINDNKSYVIPGNRLNLYPIFVN